MMKRIYNAILLASLLLYTRLATTAALPVVTSTNDALLRESHNASLASAGLVAFTRLVLFVYNIGQDIPEHEVEDTLRAANRAISHEVDKHPEQRIPGDEFGYRGKDGKMLLLVVPNIGEEISWNQLSRVLHALHQFMTGRTGATAEHYQTLDFEIRTLSRKVVGFGLVRYFPSGSSTAQRRALLSPLASDVHETDPQLPNVLNARERIIYRNARSFTRIRYPIPDTPVTLIITSFGIRIPNFELAAGLTNALRKIQSLGGRHAHEPIPSNIYWYRDNVSHLWISILSITRHTIYWQQLRWVVAGLLRWMKDDNCRELAFEFGTIGEGIIGSGSVGYDPMPEGASNNASAIGKRTAAAKESTVQLHGSAVLSPVSPPVGDCTKIPDMGLELCFHSFGHHIPAYEVSRMFNGAFTKIKTHYGGEDQDRVPNNFFNYDYVSGDTGQLLSVTIQGDPRATILWVGLQRIMVCLSLYMRGVRPLIPNQQPHLQTLKFDIITFGNAKMGTGTVQHTSEVSTIRSVKRRSSANDTALQLSGVGSNGLEMKTYGGEIISGRKLDLSFRYRGDAAPSSSIDALFNQALLDFPDSEDPMPGKSFQCRTPYDSIDGGASLTIAWLSSYRMKYSMLHRILLDLRGYVNGDKNVGQHYQDLGFEMTEHGGIRFGRGMLWCVAGKTTFAKPGVDASWSW